jgi:hypothetical protein
MSAQPNLGPDQPSIAPPVPLPPSPTSPASPTFASVPTQLPPTLSTPQVVSYLDCPLKSIQHIT